MSDWVKILDPNFINAEIIGKVGSSMVVTIKAVDQKETYDQQKGKKDLKWSVEFEECKPLVLNKTNIKTLMRIFGKDTNQCIGHKIQLVVEEVKAFGEKTTGIRIKEFSEVKCERCGKVILPAAGRTVDQLVEIGVKNTGKKLCLKCMQEVKKEMEAKQNG